MSRAGEAAIDRGLKAVELLGSRYTALHVGVAPYGERCFLGAFSEEFRRGAFTESLLAQPRIPLLLWHDSETFPIGASDPYGWDDRLDGLYGRFELLLTSVAQYAASLVDEQVLTGASIGFVPLASEWRPVADAEWDPTLGADHVDTVVRTAARLVEVSLTATPAYLGALVTGIESEPVGDQIPSMELAG